MKIVEIIMILWLVTYWHSDTCRFRRFNVMNHYYQCNLFIKWNILDSSYVYVRIHRWNVSQTIEFAFQKQVEFKNLLIADNRVLVFSLV